MSIWEEGTSTHSTKESIDPLLPHVAGVIEALDVATFSDIKKQIENDLNQEIADAALVRALEAGVKLGMLKMHREFKVCREFTTKEIKKFKHMEANLLGAKSMKRLRLSKPDRELMNFVRTEREKRSTKKRRKVESEKNIKKSGKPVYDFVCNDCKQDIEEESEDEENEEESVTDNRLSLFNLGADSSSSESNKNSRENINNDGTSSQSETMSKRTNLLIQKNSMEIEAPYCDIFT